ncbi:DctP family TRAP transporter solute-binding subunit [Bacillus sp. JCM 19041]|uniref:DctP family TRAP transporter solute-binding subunit n=1 Tax=Bacillus sp. JCM 19041 TaxID=1460637 RepID=UPI000B23A330
MKPLYKLTMTASIIFICSACSLGSEAEESTVMRIGNATPNDRSLSQAMFLFADRLEEETNGSIVVEVYTNSQIGGDRELFEGMQLNTIQAATISTGPIAQFADSFNVFELPFLFTNEEEAYYVLDGEVGRGLLNELEQQNVIGLNYWENGFRMLSNDVREVHSLEDIAGLDIRTLENKWHLQLWRELKGNPTPMNYGELYIGLEQGTVNGQENPIGNVVNSHFYEVQRYLTTTNHIYNASPFMVSKPFWDSITEEERQAITQVADEVQIEQRKANQQEAVDSVQYLEEQGMTISHLEDEEVERLREATEPVRVRYEYEYDNDWLEQIQQAVAEKE